MRCGRKVDGKTKYFRKDDGAFLEREARLARGPDDTTGEAGGRVAARPSVYVGLASPAFGFANIIEDVGRRAAARPSIYVRYASPTFRFANTIGDVWRRIAARPSICVEFASPAFG